VQQKTKNIRKGGDGGYTVGTPIRVLSFVGLWDLWKNRETRKITKSCTILVTGANELARPIHDRMPVVLDKADIRRWLNGQAGTELLKPAAEDRLRTWPISRRVNKTGNGDDDPTFIDEVAGCGSAPGAQAASPQST
jgi:putative SOS response-associated peptidase YedK